MRVIATSLSKVNVIRKVAGSIVVLTRATETGQRYDTTLTANIAFKTQNDGIAELNEYIYVEIPAEVDSEFVEYVVVETVTDAVVQRQIADSVQVLTEVTIQVPVSTTLPTAVSILTSQTALAN